MKQKSVQDVDVLGHFRKTNIRYWQKIAHGRRGETFPLGAPNKATALPKARDIYLSLVARGRVGVEPSTT